MELELSVRTVLFFSVLVILTLLHWKLVFESLEDLVKREKVLGGRKAPWALAIIFFTYFGSILYMLAHGEAKAEAKAETTTDEWVIRRYK